ncbi:TetR/AcrR family transcriptional regulator [Fodinicola feengrottensis]|uniref:TetR/AcrR family transcriptional regulator n=1 Tax=Fodinicola feengrottensis TaxID=435914 RepID=A0ABN2IEF2_9ACTN
MSSSQGPYHHGNLRAALLDAAVRRIRESGIEGLSLRELARELGVSHSAPRRHFPDKQSLLDALAVVGLDRLGEQLDAALDHTDEDFARQLTAFATTYVRFASNGPQLLELMFLRKEDATNQELREANQRAFGAPVRLIEEACKRGQIDDSDRDRVEMAILAVLQGLATLVVGRMAGNRSIDQLVTGTVHALIEGLRPRD